MGGYKTLKKWYQLSREERRLMFERSYDHYKKYGSDEICNDMLLTKDMEDGEFQKLVSLLLLGGANVEI
jgi:hypothetical protein